MGTLDKYIIRKFLTTFFFIIVAFIIISVVIDLSDRMDDFIEHQVPLGPILIGYYLNFCINFGNLLSGLLIFLTVVLVCSNMAQRTEVIAILSGGVSFNRYLRPFFVASTFLVILFLIVSHFVLPAANKRKMVFDKEYMDSKLFIRDKNLHREISPGELVYFKSISADKFLGTKFCLENWEDGVLKKKIMADRATYFPEEKKWQLNRGHMRKFYEDGSQSFEKFDKKDTVLNLTINDFGFKSNISTAMSWSEITEFIEDLERKGSPESTKHALEKHQRTSIPFSIYIFVLIAVCIASRKLRGGTGIHLMLAVVIGFAYVFFQRIASVSATNAGVDPLIAVWIPNVIFLILGIWVYWRAPK